MTMDAGALGILGGSGLYEMPGLEDARERVVQTPFGAPSAPIVEARLGGRRLLFLPRHGRSHHLAAHEVNYRANVYALKAAGAAQVLSVSAVGSLRLALAPGHVVLVDQYIDRTRHRPSTFFEGVGVVVHASLADPVDGSLRAALGAAAHAAGATVHERGTYVCIDGPQFSTRAESRLFQPLGCDVVGMTNLPEARLAREAELPYASLCLVTDYDCWHEAEKPVEVATVLAQLRANATLATEIVRRLVPHLPEASASAAARALDAALLTPVEAISQQARERLGVLLDRVLAGAGRRG